MSGKKNIHAIGLMKSLINQLTDGNELSTFHSMYALLSLKSLCYSQALPIISKSYLDVLPHTKAVEILTYYYYSGMILMGMNKFKEAIAKMSKLLLLPTTCAHQVYVDAFKKLVLMGMIEGYEYRVSERA